MRPHTLRPSSLRSAIPFLSIIFAVASLALLAGCGSRSTVCPLAASGAGDCTCGPVSTNACPAQQLLYADGVDGNIYGFPVFGTSVQSPVSTPGASQSLGMTAMNGYLYVSNPNTTLGGASSIDEFGIQFGTGGVTTVSGSPFSLGPFSVASGMVADPQISVIYVGDVGKIDALQQNSATGVLAPITGSPFPGGTNIYLTIDPSNRFLFASEDSPPGNVLAYTIGGTGALTAAPGSPYAIIPGYSGTTRPFGIVVDSSGSFVYVAMSATNQIAAFSIDQSTGALTPVPGSPFATGTQPLNLVAVLGFLYAPFGGQVYGYSIDATTGVLTPLANSPFAIQAGVFSAPAFGQFLYAAGAGGLITLSVDSQTGALTQQGPAVPFPGATVLAYVP